MKLLLDQTLDKFVEKACEEDKRVLPTLKKKALRHVSNGGSRRFLEGVQFADEMSPDHQDFLGVVGLFGLLLFETGTNIHKLVNDIRAVKLVPLPQRVAVKVVFPRLIKAKEAVGSVQTQIKEDLRNRNSQGKITPRYVGPGGTPAGKMPFPVFTPVSTVAELLSWMKDVIDFCMMVGYSTWEIDKPFRELRKVLGRAGVVDSAIKEASDLLDVKDVLER